MSQGNKTFQQVHPPHIASGRCVVLIFFHWILYSSHCFELAVWPLPGFAAAEYGGITKHYTFHTSVCPLKLEGGDFGSILLYAGNFSDQIAECYKIVP